MSRSKREKGFVLFFVIVMLAVIGTYMIILTRDANIIVFQTQRAYLEACGANMVASGRTWAQENVNVAVGTFELDTSEFGVGQSALRVAASSREGGQRRIGVSSQCTRQQLTVKDADSFAIHTDGEG